MARGSLKGLTSGGWPAAGSRYTRGTFSSSARSALSPPLDLRTQSGWASASRLGLTCRDTPPKTIWLSGDLHPQTHAKGLGLGHLTRRGAPWPRGGEAQGLRSETTDDGAPLRAWCPRPRPSVLLAGLFLAESPAAGLCTPPGRTGAKGRALRHFQQPDGRQEDPAWPQRTGLHFLKWRPGLMRTDTPSGEEPTF